MSNYLLFAISCICMLHAGVCDEECSQAILARRQVLNVSIGSSLSLSCVVRHCGDTWTGAWVWKNTTDEDLRIVNHTANHQLMREAHTVNETKLVLKMLSVSQSDEGSYGCTVTWGGGETDRGHLMYVNITAAVTSPRNFLHRIYICATAFLCLPIILGLARCLSSKVKHQSLPSAEFTYAAVYRNNVRGEISDHQPPPRRPVPQKTNISSHKGAAPLKSQQKSEVVYADISQDSLIQQEVTREPVQSTVYSLLKFP